MKTSSWLRVFFVVSFLITTVAVAMPEQDVESIAVTLGPRAEALIMARCSVCHSADLITQQRLPRARWEAIVEKMMKWGAELSHDEAQLLLQYLTARYHPGAPDNLPPLEHGKDKTDGRKEAFNSDSPKIGVASRGAGLFEHNCRSCHGVGAMGGIGPSLVKNPILKREEGFWQVVVHGRGPMPAWGSVLSEQDIADLYAWLTAR